MRYPLTQFLVALAIVAAVIGSVAPPLILRDFMIMFPEPKKAANLVFNIASTNHIVIVIFIFIGLLIIWKGRHRQRDHAIQYLERIVR